MCSCDFSSGETPAIVTADWICCRRTKQATETARRRRQRRRGERRVVDRGAWRAVGSSTSLLYRCPVSPCLLQEGSADPPRITVWRLAAVASRMSAGGKRLARTIRSSSRTGAQAADRRSFSYNDNGSMVDLRCKASAADTVLSIYSLTVTEGDRSSDR